jgi:phospholipid/cholesterol/gamma-HCH transport system substrate-binding protein
MSDMGKRLRWSKLKAGLVITLALLTLFITIFFAGSLEDLFSKKIVLKIQIQDVKGLRKGAPVWIFGTEIGSVMDIQLHSEYGTIVTISIDKSALEFIKKDSQASVMTMGLLGDKYIELSPGSPQSGPIHSGEMIKGMAQIEFKDVMETAVASIGKMGEFINKLDNLVVQMEQSKGTIAKFFTDPGIYNDLKKATSTLSLLLEDVKNSEGTLKMLIEDPSLYNKTLAAASQIEEFSRRINESYGTLKRFVEDPSLYNRTLAAVSSIEEFSRKLKEEPGTLKRLIEDPALYENLTQGSKQLSSILERIDQGEGLAGALIRDEELTQELKETFVKFKELTVEVEELTIELKALMKDIKAHPKKYFKFSIF